MSNVVGVNGSSLTSGIIQNSNSSSIYGSNNTIITPGILTLGTAEAGIIMPSGGIVQLITLNTEGTLVTKSPTVEIKKSEALSLVGHTTPFGMITLTIHSNPRTIKIRANADGYWNYIVMGLSAGNHYIEGTVTNPSTKQVSKAVKLLAFQVQPGSVAVTKANINDNSTSDAIIAVLVVATTVSLLLVRQRKLLRSREINKK
jgi:hypothetical protein